MKTIKDRTIKVARMSKQISVTKQESFKISTVWTSKIFLEFVPGVGSLVKHSNDKSIYILFDTKPLTGMFNMISLQLL